MMVKCIAHCFALKFTLLQNFLPDVLKLKCIIFEKLLTVSYIWLYYAESFIVHDSLQLNILMSSTQRDKGTLFTNLDNYWDK